MITFLSGGTGTPKLIQGFRQLITDNEIAVITNSADDIWLYGLYISPDLDTIIYLFSGLLDEGKYWGIENDSFHTLNFLKKIEKEIWFNLGDKDLAIHLYRTKKIKEEKSLSQITFDITKNLNINARIFPSSENHIETRIITKDGKDIHFQEFWVKHKGKIPIERVYFKDIETAKVPEQVLQVLDDSEIVIIGPSNPITSIGPIIKIKAIRNWLMKNKDKCIAISPVIGEKPVSGPTAELMKAEGRESTPLGVAEIYKDLCTLFIIDSQDKDKAKEIEKKTELNVEAKDILFHDVEIARKLAKYILNRGSGV
ncbi:MAG: 2-phospho-L-lactate transferase [Candidatus Heimdallarchaeaceae archaeon]|jgi:LPPG:FO 2-phospho-L-lactate transferase